MNPILSSRMTKTDNHRFDGSTAWKANRWSDFMLSMPLGKSGVEYRTEETI